MTKEQIVKVCSLKLPDIDVCDCGLGFSDIDECTPIDPCDNGVCVNTEPGFTCNCNTGYALNTQGTNCVGKEHVRLTLLYICCIGL